ncbi:hypothetical protein [Hoyosella subflava]|uniref:Uncharacterized protein n=1 Tax=Hoyosella subflava (strain DSM 45089 / JCM 17490 / NBRC 109087 / DQS3-9A1) TaxID=443218 RepID=F6EQ02_HOYSD|nr:hypothetical protein [Hoyosella subflava]AEF41823.1 hypothetical protein AS9A_3382 [Hoyosella subflava DQS3-9A1]
MDHVTSINDIRTAIRELRVRETEARKDGREAEADEIAGRIRDYQQELSERP